MEVLVVGAGQAGLSAAYHLRRKGLVPEGASATASAEVAASGAAATSAGAGRFVVLDANDGPGGAWRHRWPSLTLGTVHGIHDLPGKRLGAVDPTEPAAQVVPRYYAEYEREMDLRVRRPVRVTRVTSPDGPQGRLLVKTSDGSWATHELVNATGTWDRPHWPYYPGRETFRGRQLHTHDFTGAEEFRGQHVVVVGGGISAVQFLLQLHEAGATTTWVTRRPPQFVERRPGDGWGLDVENRVAARTKIGLPPLSVVGATGIPLSEEYRRGIAAGVLRARRMFSRIEPEGVRFPASDDVAGAPRDDGCFVRADVILWATGFRDALDHLAPLGLREAGGGIRMDGTTVVRDPRIHLVGYGSSASTVGATRAGRRAALAAVERLRSGEPDVPGERADRSA
ncbi:MAG TPA: NAD(P)-binding domain-containing protein [Segeticoccus sp.]|uniref:NAD(P)-binding domain-containing protein n=1 Tax=Segeticoccus sp. TaxID=2706531 RepID=UPI002D801123|nr:NAD(P)-binding domain-containing protein [Segeticoccus sp.]HET8601709.1 NAD(P)-binding domain-containing protein [Segeticoccus sp.]